MRNIKKYDWRLDIKRKLDWSIDIVRYSTFDKWKEHIVFTITNQFLWEWVIDKLKSMDSQRFNFIEEIAKKNMELRNKKWDTRMHEDIARFMMEWKKINL